MINSHTMFTFDLQIKLDITPEKGWQSEDMFVPPGYHMDSTITDDGGSPKEAEPTAYTYPAGLGNVLMNGCYGTGYKEGDPCYVAKWTLDACLVYKQYKNLLNKAFSPSILANQMGGCGQGDCSTWVLLAYGFAKGKKHLNGW